MFEGGGSSLTSIGLIQKYSSTSERIFSGAWVKLVGPAGEGGGSVVVRDFANERN